MNPRARLAALAAVVVLSACSRPDDGAMSGYAEAELTYLAPRVAGHLQTLSVQRGDAVKSGQVLYTLDADSQALSRAAAQARSDSASAQAADLAKGKRPLELKALDEQLVQARAAAAASAATLDRNRRLVDGGFLSPLQLDELVAARDRDAARVRELQAQRELAVQAARSDTLAAAAAQVRAAEADLAQARWQEGQTQRQAPADALVFDVMYRRGEWVSAGSPVVALLPPSALKVRFFVPETRLAEAATGRNVSVHCDGCPAGLTARISYVSPQAEYTPPVIYSNSSRSKLVFLVEATPSDPRALKPGQPVDVRFEPRS